MFNYGLHFTYRWQKTSDLADYGEPFNTDTTGTDSYRRRGAEPR